MAKAKTLFHVYIQGWGDNEDQFYNFGTFSTKAKAEAELENLLQGWEADGESRDHVVWEITTAELDYI
jgi:hypothetical protein